MWIIIIIIKEVPKNININNNYTNIKSNNNPNINLVIWY